jgi:quinoprotein glucose dehydrogenase
LITLASAIDSTQPRERQYAWDQLGKLDLEGAKLLIAKGVGAYLDGSIANDCKLNVVEASVGKLSDALQKRLDTKLSEQAASKESSPVQFYEDCAEGGDIELGKSLFFTRSSLSCVRCHKVGSSGGEVGPALGSLGLQKSNSYLLEAIVAPNTTIAQGFETVLILDADGNTLSGILKSEDESQVTLMDAQGVLVKIDKESIEARRKGASSMPADLMKYMNKRELRDLVAYLKSLDGSPSATAGLNESEGGHKLE